MASGAAAAESYAAQLTDRKIKPTSCTCLCEGTGEFAERLSAPGKSLHRAGQQQLQPSHPGHPPAPSPQHQQQTHPTAKGKVESVAKAAWCRALARNTSLIRLPSMGRKKGSCAGVGGRVGGTCMITAAVMLYYAQC